ncbi:MAG: hypothetical protein XD69_0505 [Clostridia bacterium 62_21]|nr:MAG: hypothetical protein XD69_0505 [Clostridia bacterium 62_21]HAG07335.1 hypothetical protein [Peptococcaceae bacterium]
MHFTERMKEVVRHLNELVPTLQEAAKATAVLLQEGNFADGYRQLQLLIEALQHFEEGLAFLETAGFIEGTGLEDLKQRLQRVYPSILAALQERDSVQLADLLEYELAPTLVRCGPEC